MATQGISRKYVEGLRLSERERVLLIEQMKKSGVADRRKSPRMVVEGAFSVLLTMDAPCGSTTYFRIYPCDLSRSGLGFFHRNFVYPGTRCTFMGLSSTGEPFTMKGEVVRCSHVNGNVHVVGTKLAAEVDPEKLLGSAAVSGEKTQEEDWWSQVSALAATVCKLAREKAPVEAIRHAASGLMERAASDPAIDRQAGDIRTPDDQAQAATAPRAEADIAKAA